MIPILDKLKVITPIISSKLDQILSGQNIGSDLIQQVNDTKTEVQNEKQKKKKSSHQLKVNQLKNQLKVKGSVF